LQQDLALHVERPLLNEVSRGLTAELRRVARHERRGHR
jgi:hypothetical protein